MSLRLPFHSKLTHSDLAHAKLANARQRGMAVISAMLLAALTAVVVSQMVWQQQLLISEIENQQQATQANLIGKAAIQWSRAILVEDAKVSSVDHLREIWATKLPTTPIEGSTITGEILDADRFINLNNVTGKTGTSEADQQTVSRLLSLLGYKSDLVQPLTDWIDADDMKSGAEGAETSYYLTLNPPYLAANQPLSELSNLVRVKGFNAEMINKLSAYSTALPDRSSINVNTAPAEVLYAALPGSTLEEMRALVASRNSAVFNSVDDFRLRLPNPKINTNAVNLSVSSRYFIVNCLIISGKSSVRIKSLMVRDATGWPTILWTRLG